MKKNTPDVIGILALFCNMLTKPSKPGVLGYIFQYYQIRIKKIIHNIKKKCLTLSQAFPIQ
tara:strand:- start:54233 stop:54415 length:183 start_codon:yes stop_codon:yes gene_type:complete